MNIVCKLRFRCKRQIANYYKSHKNRKKCHYKCHKEIFLFLRCSFQITYIFLFICINEFNIFSSFLLIREFFFFLNFLQMEFQISDQDLFFISRNSYDFFFFSKNNSNFSSPFKNSDKML